ncbi:MAG: TonB-dependent receptor [Deltaproteobacteria bacterium]|nr:TonB-dependent receptor [Deltaproteobacteria bacterium]
MSLTLPAAAQETAPPAAPEQAAPAPQQEGVEEIVVTSRLREESIQEVPISVSAFGSEAIKAIAPSTLRDFDQLAPNVFIGNNIAGPSAGAIYIRGLGYADIEKTQTSNVGVVVDGVFLPSNTGQLVDTFDIEQITVNRGPQAVLFGRNTSAGTIVIRRGQPKLGEYEARFAANYGNYDGEGDGNQYGVQGVVNVPLNEETLALRGGVTYKKSDGFWRNSFTGEDRGGLDYTAVALKLLFQPTEDFSATLSYDWIRDRGDIPPQDALSDGDNPWINRSDRSPKEAQFYDLSLPALEINWETDFGTFTSISAYWNSRDLVLQDFDGGFFNAANPLLSDPNEPFARLHTRRHQFFDVFSQELRFAGDLMDGRLQYAAGFYFTDEDIDFQQKSEIILQVGVGLPFLGAAGLCPAIVPTWRNGPESLAVPGTQICVFPPTYTVQTSGQDTKSYGVFGSLGFDVFEWWNVSAGLRWIKEKKDFRSRFAPLAPDITGTEGSPFITVPDVSDSWDDVVFEASTRVDVGELLSSDTPMQVYYRYAEGFRSGGFSMRATDPLRAPFDPEDTTAHELGFKSELFDGRFTFNVAGFFTKLEGAQFSSIITIPTPPGTNTLILNHGTTELYGAELETSFNITEDLRTYFTFGYQAGELLDSLQNPQDLPDPTNQNFPRPPGPPIDVACFPAGPQPCSRSGFELFRQPKFAWTLGLSYGLDLGPGRASADVRWKRTDEYVLGAFGGTPLFQSKYDMFETNLAYTWNWGEREVRAAFVGKNLANEKYIDLILFLGAGGFQNWGAPRYLGVEFGIEI